MLQEFLNNNLILLTEDDNVEKLKKSSTALSKELVKSKTQIRHYTLVVLDPEISPDNIYIQETQQIIAKNWKTFMANCKDTPITYIRAVIFDALEIISRNDIYVASLIWLSGRNIQKHLNIIGKEKELILNFLLGLGERVQEEANNRWSLPSKDDYNKLTNIQIEELSITNINETELLNGIKAAAIHSGHQNGGENPSMTNQNNVTWSKFFSEKASQAISSAVNSVIKEEHNKLSAFQTRIRKVINQMIEQLQSEFLEKNNMLQMRNHLLWWKESCFSSSINKSYRSQKNGVLQLLLATDYSDFVPFIYPTSADYFLRETHNSLLRGEEAKEMQVLDFLKEIVVQKEQLQAILSEPKKEEERISFLDFIVGLVWNRYEPNEFSELLGFSESTEILLSDLTLWIFHDLQALKLQ